MADKIIGLETEGKMDSKFGGVATYRTAANGDHIANDGTVLSTKESRAKEDVPQWKQFELGRIEIVNNYVIPGPNALPRDWEKYGKHVEPSGILKTRPEMKEMNVTSICLEVGGILKEGDRYICPVGIKEYPKGFDELIGRVWISDVCHVGMRPQESAGQRYRETVTNADKLTFELPRSYKWEERNVVKLTFYFRKENVQMKATPKWSCERDIPAVKREEVEEEPTAEVRTVADKIMPDDPEFTPLEKAMNWAAETHHGKAHQDRWNQVAAALGADNGYTPAPKSQIKSWWLSFNKNARWSMAMEAIGQSDDVAKREEEMAEYNSPLSMQGHYSLADWDRLHGSEATICKVEGFDKLTIWDAGCQQPNFWLEEEFAQPTEQYRLMLDGGLEFVRYFSNAEMNGDEAAPSAEEVNAWRKDHGMDPLNFPNGVEPYPEECVFRVPGEPAKPEVKEESSVDDLETMLAEQDEDTLKELLQRLLKMFGG